MPVCLIMERLRAKQDFERVFSAGQRVQNSLATLLVAPREEAGVSIGFAVGRRFGGAVRRNRLKRRLREACRKEVSKREIRGGWEVVCLPRLRAQEADFAALCEALASLFGEAGLFSSEPREASAG